MRTGYIYKITSPSNRIYIGQALDIDTRKSQYRRLRCKCQQLLYNSLCKHGWENHKFEVIEELLSENYLNEILSSLEKYWIGFYKSNYSRYGKGRGTGLNLTDGGDGIKGYNHTLETKMKLGKRVDCYNLDGSFFRTFYSIQEATEFILGKKLLYWNSSISQAIKEKNKCFDKIWKYSDQNISVVSEIMENISGRGNDRFVKGQNLWSGRKHSEKTVEGFRNRTYSKATRLKMSNSAKARGNNRNKTQLS